MQDAVLQRDAGGASVGVDMCWKQMLCAVQNNVELL
jgi:hypothetical protein